MRFERLELASGINPERGVVSKTLPAASLWQSQEAYQDVDHNLAPIFRFDSHAVIQSFYLRLWIIRDSPAGLALRQHSSEQP